MADDDDPAPGEVRITRVLTVRLPDGSASVLYPLTAEQIADLERFLEELLEQPRPATH